jgi:hypothetical protein
MNPDPTSNRFGKWLRKKRRTNSSASKPRAPACGTLRSSSNSCRSFFAAAAKISCRVVPRIQPPTRYVRLLDTLYGEWRVTRPQSRELLADSLSVLARGNDRLRREADDPNSHWSTSRWRLRTGSDDTVFFERTDLGRRQSQPVAVDLAVVLAELRAGHGVDRVGAVDAQWCRRHDDTADLVVLDPFGACRARACGGLA